MKPHCERDSQFELFESLSSTPREPKPLYALPFQQSDEIDIDRASRILGTSGGTVRRIARAGLLRWYDGPSGWRIHYDSVVEYCDQLCVRYGIARRVRRPERGRLRDRDLLPFPLDETANMAEVTGVLRCSVGAAIRMLDEGVLVGYQLQIDAPNSPFRIWRRSVEDYLASLRSTAERRPAPTIHPGASER